MQYSASISGKCSLTMKPMPMPELPSSPASERKITSRSSGTFEALQQQHRHQRGGEVVLVVDRAAAVDVAAVAGRAERRELPLRLVDVTVSLWPMRSSGRLLPLPFSRATRFAPLRIGAEDLRRDAFLLEHLLEVLDQRFRCPADCGCRCAAAPGSAASSRPAISSSPAAKGPGRGGLRVRKEEEEWRAGRRSSSLLESEGS